MAMSTASNRVRGLAVARPHTAFTDALTRMKTEWSNSEDLAQQQFYAYFDKEWLPNNNRSAVGPVRARRRPRDWRSVLRGMNRRTKKTVFFGERLDIGPELTFTTKPTTCTPS